MEAKKRVAVENVEGGRRKKAKVVIDCTGEAPEPLFHLTKLKDAPASHNEGAVGLADLLEGEFSSCLLTNYMYDMDWLLGKCPRLRSVPVVLVHGDRDPKALVDCCLPFKNIQVVTPSLPIPYGTHHTKMMVIKYETKVRVAIFTANFISSDWEKKTQGVWYQDFGLKSGGTKSKDEKTWPDFESDLVNYLMTLGHPAKSFCQDLSAFDFSTAQAVLIPSVPGYHKGKDMKKYGHYRVREVLQKLNVPKTDHPLIAQFSSLGSIDEKWLYGEFTDSLIPMATARPKGNPLPISALHLIWPSVDDVRNSLEGWRAGGSLPCTLKNMKPFLHKYLRKWSPPECLHRQRAMPHIKTYARYDMDPDKRGAVDWAILTSANMSKAAWGALQKNGSQLMIRSYELGVLFLPQLTTQNETSLTVVGSTREGKLVGDGQLVTRLPLPYSFPLHGYDPRSDEPWVWDLPRDDPDIFGMQYSP